MSYEPIKAIVLYKNKESNYYLDEKDIKKHNEHYVLGNSKNIDVSFIKNVFKRLVVNESDDLNFKKEIFSKNIIYFNNTIEGNISLAWIREKSRQKLHFSKTTEIKSDYFNLPKLLFVLNNKKLKVFSIISDEVSNDTELYFSPFYNVNNVGLICLGNVKVKQSKSINELIKNYENGFFNSYFTANHNNKLINKDYKTHCENSKDFTDDLLVNSGLKIIDVL